MAKIPFGEIPFPDRQVFVSVGSGSYIALSKIHFKPLPVDEQPTQAPSPAHPPADPPWHAKVANKLNTALAALNSSALQANRQYEGGAKASTALVGLNKTQFEGALRAINEEVHGFFWPPVRPPFRGRKKYHVQSDQFPLKQKEPGQHPEDGLPPKHKGYVIFHCDAVIAPDTHETHEVASWGFVTNFSLVFWPESEGSSEDLCIGVSDRGGRWGEDCESSSSSSSDS